MDVGRFKFKSTSLLELKNMFPIVVKLSNKQLNLANNFRHLKISCDSYSYGFLNEKGNRLAALIGITSFPCRRRTVTVQSK